MIIIKYLYFPLFNKMQYVYFILFTYYFLYPLCLLYSYPQKSYVYHNEIESAFPVHLCLHVSKMQLTVCMWFDRNKKYKKMNGSLYCLLPSHEVQNKKELRKTSVNI